MGTYCWDTLGIFIHATEIPWFSRIDLHVWWIQKRNRSSPKPSFMGLIKTRMIKDDLGYQSDWTSKKRAGSEVVGCQFTELIPHIMASTPSYAISTQFYLSGNGMVLMCLNCSQKNGESLEIVTACNDMGFITLSHCPGFDGLGVVSQTDCHSMLTRGGQYNCNDI